MRTLERMLGRTHDYLTTLDGTRFRGSIQALSDTVSNVVAGEERLALQVRGNTPIRTGQLIKDQWDRIFLLADHDSQVWSNTRAGRVFKLFRMTEQVSWKRVQPTIDVVTRLPKADQENELGPIWIGVENTGDASALGVSEDRQRIFTGSPVKPGDKVRDAMVKRVSIIFGVTVAEIR